MDIYSLIGKAILSMQIQPVTNPPKFRGKLIILNDLSHKPDSCVNKVKKDLQEMIRVKDYNLYLEQDYSTNKINFAVSSLYPRYISGVIRHEELPITVNPKRYIYAARNAINNYEKAQSDKEQKEWALKQKQQNIDDLKDIAGTVLLSPLFLMEGILQIINPKWATKLDKLIDRMI